MNNFIKYLNSLNNVNGSNENALAESQILNRNYNEIVIDRKISNYIFDLLFNGEENTAIVLTGHAGDGKTSILIQILGKLGYFNNGVKTLYEFEEWESSFLYVKDMSELNEEKQEIVFQKFSDAPSKGMSSLLISNTGPLINTVKRLLEKELINENEFMRSERIEGYEVELLSEIDNVVGNVKQNGKIRSFKVINLAKIDNTYFIGEIINKLIKEELWEPCLSCSGKDKCPIYNNYEIIASNQFRIVGFIERLYFWLADNQQRLTIRQMLSHLSYSITGNLECDEVIKKVIKNKDAFFQYNFANLFFGHIGTKKDRNSINIKAVREMNDLKLEEYALYEDYDLFVKQNYEVFEENLRKILESTLKNNFDKLGINNKETVYMRRAFRRFYILYSKIDEDKYNALLSQIFSEIFPYYYQLVTEDKTKCITTKPKIKEIVFTGLFKYLVGVFPKNKDELYLTLRKNNNDFQKVQLILGTVKKNQIKIEQKAIDNNIEQSNKNYKVLIKIEDEEFELSYQTLYYLNNISKGKIYTKLNPSFTFDLTKLKSILLSKYAVKDDEPTIKVLLITNSDIREIELGIAEEKLYEV